MPHDSEGARVRDLAAARVDDLTQRKNQRKARAKGPRVVLAVASMRSAISISCVSTSTRVIRARHGERNDLEAHLVEQRAASACRQLDAKAF